MECNNTRQFLKIRMEKDGLSLRQLESLTGVSFATLSRFIRGSQPSVKSLENIKAFLLNKRIDPPRIVSQKRMICGGKVFLVTIEQLNERGEKCS